MSATRKKINPALDNDITNAIESFDKDRVAKLLENGANPNALIKSFRRNAELHIAEEKHLLHLALELGDNDIVNLLLNHGADPFLKNSQGKSAIQLAISHNPDAIIFIDDHWKLSPSTLGEALWFTLHEHPHRSQKQIETLLERGADPNFSRKHTSHTDSHKGKTSCLALAVGHASPELIKIMLEHGATDEAFISSLKKKKKEAFEEILKNTKQSPDFETRKQENIKKRNAKETEACPEEKAVVAEIKRIEQEAEKKQQEAEAERVAAILKRRAEVEAIEREAAEKAREVLHQKQYTAFEKIYTALRDGQSSLIKTNFLASLQKLSLEDKITAISTHANEKKSSRTAKAWELAQTHADNTSSQNVELFESIYNWSFSQSGVFKQSKLTGSTFFKSGEAFKQSLDRIKLFPDEIHSAAENNSNSRTAKIVAVLGK